MLRRSSFLVACALASLFALPSAGRAATYVTVELILFNLTAGPITATWTDASGNQVSNTVAAQSMLYLGPQNINVKDGSAFALSIDDENNDLTDARYTIDAENCNAENWLYAQSNVPECGTEPYSYVIYEDDEYICIQGPATNPLDAGQSPNSAVGVSSGSASCESSTDTPLFTSTFNAPDASFTWPIALGTYSPTASNVTQPILPGVSPSGVTPCLGSVCVIPNAGNDFNFWPVTIYWAASGGLGLFNYNADDSFQMSYTYSGFNIPSHLTSFGEDFTADTYQPPAAVAYASSTYPELPAPCVPVFTQGPTGNDLFSGCNGAISYTPNPNAQSGTAGTVLGIAKDVASGMKAVTAIAGLF